jgi:hypothetical protein
MQREYGQGRQNGSGDMTRAIVEAQGRHKAADAHNSTMQMAALRATADAERWHGRFAPCQLTE